MFLGERGPRNPGEPGGRGQSFKGDPGVDCLPAADDARVPREGGAMEIAWRRDVDRVLQEAKNLRRPVLLDFSAAPM